MTESGVLVDTARVIVTVQAGVVPGVADPKLMRSYVLSNSAWERAGEDQAAQMELLAQFNGGPAGYVALLQLQPDAVNWVTSEWVWV